MTRLRLPKTIWIAWCQTCASWLDETEAAKYSANLARDEHPEHFSPHDPHDVEVIPYRLDRRAARKVK